MFDTSEDRLMPQRDHIIPHGDDVRVALDLAVEKEHSSSVSHQKIRTRTNKARRLPRTGKQERRALCPDSGGLRLAPQRPVS